MQTVFEFLNEPGPVRWVLDVLVFPLLAILAIIGLRALFLRIPFEADVFEGYRRVRRQTSKITATILSIAAVGLIWRVRLTDLAQRTADTDAARTAMGELVWGIGKAVLITAAFLLSLYLVRKLFAVAQARVTNLAERAGGIRFQRAVFVSPTRIRQLISLGLRLGRIVVVVLLLYFYIPLTLSFIPATRPIADQVMPILMGPAARVGLAIIGYIPNLITLILIIIAVRFMLRLIRALFVAVGKEEISLPGFDPEWADQTHRLIRIVAVLATVMIIYPFLPGSGSEVFRGFSLFAGALFTLGASSSVTNIIAGVILTYTRSFRVDDRIQLGGAFGDVVAKGLFVTRIRTPLNEEVTIPNSVAMGGRVVNYSAAHTTPGLVLTVRAGIGYDVDWRRVHELMKNAAAETDNVLVDPEPFVLQESLGDYAVVYELRAHTDDPKAAIQTQSDLRGNVLDAFNQARIEIMTPAVNAVRNSAEPTIPAEYVDKPAPSALRMLGLES